MANCREIVQELIPVAAKSSIGSQVCRVRGPLCGEVAVVYDVSSLGARRGDGEVWRLALPG